MHNYRNFAIISFSIALLVLMCRDVKAQNVDQHSTPEDKLIILRKQLENATNASEQNKLLKQIGKTGTFIGMATAAKWMSIKDTEKTAAENIAKIAMSHIEYDGTNTRNWLKQASSILNGSKRRAIINYLKLTSDKEVGFVSIFNGKNLEGWEGLVENPIKRAQMSQNDLAEAQKKADEVMKSNWKVENNLLTYIGTGYDNICTIRQYGDFEMYVDWKLDSRGKEPDDGIYLRGTPQVQIWDISRIDVGAQVGSGGLYNNQKNESKPIQVVDNKNN